VTLTRDLVCPGDGLTIARRGVVLDLGGHTIRGTGPDARVGVRIVGAGDFDPRIVLRNGTITGFAEGILANTYIADVLIDGMTISGGTIYGVVTRLSVTRSTFRGVRTRCGTSTFHIDRSRFTDSPFAFGDCDTSSVTASRFEAAPGAALSVTNTFSHRPGDPPGITVTGSVFRSNGTGIDIYGLVDSALVADNLFVGNGTGLIATPDPAAAMVEGTVRRNLFVLNRGDGLRLVAGTWTVGHNVAVANGGTGIAATGNELALVDEGGNVAAGNGGPQCTGLPCRP
jgi:hypothetical protein